MRSLQELFAGRLRQDGGNELLASAVVAVANDALQQRWVANDAQAKTFSRGAVMIVVGHSAVAGEIHLHEHDLLVSINRRLADRFPTNRVPVSSIHTRVGPIS